MNALVWRLHRNQVVLAGAALLAVAAVLLVTGATMAADYHQAVAACSAAASCGNLDSELFRGDGAIIDLVNATIAVPLLFGLFWAAPLVGREFEEGTHNLAWSQSVTRRQWMTAKAGWAMLVAVAWGAALSALVTWWRAPENALYGRFQAFDVQGLLPIAYSICAMAIGIAMGAMLRRVMPAVAATLTTFAALRAVVALYLRPHYRPPVRSVISAFSRGRTGPLHAWILDQYFIGPQGQKLGDNAPVRAGCQYATRGATCVAQHGIRLVTVYQPDSRFWSFQAIESGIFLVIAAAFLVAGFLAVLRRDA